MTESITMFKPGTRWEITHWSDDFDGIYRIVYPNILEQMMGQPVRIVRDKYSSCDLPKWIDLA